MKQSRILSSLARSRVLSALAAALIMVSMWPMAARAQSFPDQLTYGATSGGSAGAYTLSLGSYGRYVAGVPIRFIPNFDSPGASTLNINGLGAKNILEPTGSGLATLGAGRIKTGQPVELLYDGAQFTLMSSPNDLISRVPPQGYLTPCQVSSGTPVTGCPIGGIAPTGDVNGASTLFYEPVGGDKIPIWNGANWVIYTFTEAQLTLTLNSTNNLANTVYDACVAAVAGVPTIMTGPAWTNSTPGSAARGNTTGTAAISLQNGVWTNTFQISGKNGLSSFTIPAGQCTIVATVLIDPSAGQVTFSRTYGQLRRQATWNFYNRLALYLKAGDTTTSWSTSLNTISTQPANGSASNNLIYVVGLPEEFVDLQYVQNMNVSVSSSASDSSCAIGVNSTSVSTGKVGRQLAATSSPSQNTTTDGVAAYLMPPSLGPQTITALQTVTSNTNPRTWYGTETYMLLTAKWRG